ncbi:MAG: DUF3105 domain-containing protein [Actinomycetia bacterium]|nr:DUF3105 domain-containing protein [Actinomycetes bacterium]
MKTGSRFTLAVSVVFALGSLVGCSINAEPTPEPTDGGIEGVQTFGDLARDHTTDDVEYPHSPPVGGDHDPQWMDCTGTVYEQPLRNENAVHSLEHGAVWITYTDAVSQADIDALAAKVEGQPYSFMSPYPDQGSPITLTAWGVQLGLESADDPRVDEFLTAYRSGPQTPEPGATCGSGLLE